MNVFLLFRNYPPLEKVWAHRLNKLEYPSHKDALCQVWLKLAWWFWRGGFLHFVNVLLFCNYLTLEKGVALHCPSPKDVLCQVWLKLGGSGEEDFYISSMYIP